MNEASVQGFVRTILIIIAVYYAFKIIAKIFMPLFLKSVASKFEQKMKDQANKGTPQDKDYKVGETTIDKKPQQTKGSNDSVGEYVDYEEVD